jgi:melanoma-associated antigen p97
MDVSIYDIGSSGLAMEALRFGNADIAMNIDGGPAWVGWNAYGLDVMAADTKSDGRAFYNAHAWVKNGSDIAEAYLDEDNTTDPFALMEGKTSCHTGWLKSAGMLMPMGYLIGNGYVNVAGDMNDTETLRTTINNYFDGSNSGGNAASIPESGALYSGYDGAVECLSSGYGDVAFAKDSTIGSYCDNEVATDNAAWCLPMNQYVALPKFGSSPSHAVMFNDAVLDDDKEVLIRNALVAMKDDAAGLDILTNVLGTSAMIATDADTHLGTYGAALMNIPGISSKYGNAFSDGTATGAIKSTINVAYYLADDASTNANAQGMADRLASDLGVNVNLYDVSSEGMIIQALRFGTADIAFMEGGPAWIGWKQYGLSTLAVETTTATGDTYYNASAWVLKGTDVANATLDDDESTDPFALLEGKTSCHTGWLKSAGMLMPMGYLIGNGYVNPVGDATDINSLRLTIDAHFDGSKSNGNAASIPDSGALYYGYGGAVECLSSGYGDVAFAKGDDFSTVDKYCGSTNASDNEAWCLEMDQYVQLPSFGQSPSHPVMYNADFLDVHTRNAILNAMLNWGDEMWVQNYSMAGQTFTGCYHKVTHQVADIPMNQCGSEIISTVTSKGYKLNAGNSQNHLGSYSSLLEAIPGLSQYYHADKYGITAAETTA